MPHEPVTSIASTLPATRPTQRLHGASLIGEKLAVDGSDFATMLPRCQRTAGKKHGTPAYHSSGRCHPDRRQVAGDRLRAFRLGQVAATHSAGDAQDVTENILGSRARAANGPGSLLNGLGREVVESSDLFRNRCANRIPISPK